MSLSLYSLVRPILFSLQPETAHELVMSLASVGRCGPLRALIEASYQLEDPRLQVNLFGLKFPGPVGLAAGIDKNIRAVELLSAFGPASIEVGVVSAKPQPGNQGVRIWRFPEQRALVNFMGNPNIGADAARLNLQRLRSSGLRLPPIGLNIGKTTATPLSEAVADCAYTLSTLAELVDYFIINVSCPNVAEYSKLQERERLLELLSGLQAANKFRKPLVVKLSADLSETQIDEALDCCLQSGVAGIIASNTTTARDGLPSHAPTKGGMSGVPLYPRALKAVRYCASRLQGKLPIIGVGGISSCNDVVEMLRAGATMVEVYTALVYQGPGLLKQLKLELLAYLERQGLTHVSQLVGRP
ncbi:MAG: quinone-dependent dihydroorotate dehydrogenase [Oligoflexia bacterium]|nr:quinone-dependent dihydroorotate dehydrogenase [Oligoflexia bacterium]